MLMSASDGIVKLAATRSLNHALSGQNQLRLITEFHSGGLKHFVQGNHRAVSQLFPDTAFRLTPERRGLAQMGSSFAGDLDRSNAAIVGIFDADNRPQNRGFRSRFNVDGCFPRRPVRAPIETWSWLFNVWGFADLSYAVYQGVIGISPRALGAAYFLPTAIVPLLFITHGLIFWLLHRSRQPAYS